MRETLDFLSELALHNDREWFNLNKERYLRCHKRFETFTAQYIERLTTYEPTFATLTPSDCIWRIYRDVRFRVDKSPYKTWFGTYPAAPTPGVPHSGGKKSVKAGYYVHIQPGQCMFAAGMWNPQPELLKELRQEIQANADELEQIMSSRQWQRFFTDFDTYNMLKKVPAGFDANHPHADWLKRKAFTVSTFFSDEQVCRPDFLDLVMEATLAAKPLNDFLNFTFELY